jgi:hypothetical protein
MVMGTSDHQCHVPVWAVSDSLFCANVRYVARNRRLVFSNKGSVTHLTDGPVTDRGGSGMAAKPIYAPAP